MPISSVQTLIKKWKMGILLKPNYDQVDQQKFLPQLKCRTLEKKVVWMFQDAQ